MSIESNNYVAACVLNRQVQRTWRHLSHVVEHLDHRMRPLISLKYVARPILAHPIRNQHFQSILWVIERQHGVKTAGDIAFFIPAWDNNRNERKYCHGILETVMKSQEQ